MNSPAEQQSFILIRRLADGRIEWVPLEAPQHVPAAPETAFTLIDRANYEAPQTLVAERLGEDLVVKVHGTEVLVLNGFFAAADVTFYPTTNIGSGAGPFSGSPLTPESAVPGAAVAGEQVASSANDDGEGTGSGEEETGSGSQAGGGSSPLLWVGLGVGGLGLALLAGGGGGSGGESGGSVPPPASDTVPPTITSAVTAAPIAENSGPGQLVYTATATDAGTITYSLKAGGDAAAFSINATTGAVILTGNPDFEAKPSYSFTVVATDAAGNSSERAVSLGINDLSDSGPLTITSGATATPINENSGAQQVVYTATATGTGVVTYSLKPVGDAAAFSINANTGAVSLVANPDQEAKPSYNFTFVATDVNGSSERAVSLAINDLDDSAPTITSGPTATAINENSGVGQVVYTVKSTDTGDISTGSTTYSLKPGGDAAAFGINASTGAVTLTANPDFETKPNYTFTVVATDTAGNGSERVVSLAVNNRDDSAPIITSGATATAIDENIGANRPVYTVTSTDTGDVSGVTTYSLKAGGDATAFTISANSGVVRLIANPNFEAKPSYGFTVVATDTAGNSGEQAVSLAINNLDDTPPTINSPATATAINENSGAGQLVYTVTSTDTGDISTGTTTYSLKPVNDAAAFTINTTTGAVTLTANPDDEAKGSYSFTVVATDAAGNSSERAVSLGINDLDEVAPTITSSATATINENIGSNQIVYTVTSTDTGDISTGATTYSLKPVNDSALFTIDSTSGAVRLTANPDFEAKQSYSFTVVATDAADHNSELGVSLAVTDLDETPPTVSAIALSSAGGVLHIGDIVTATVTMSETTVVSGGTPSIELQIGGGGDRVDANYVSGSGTTALVFQYTIQPGDNDADGISIPNNPLDRNNSSITDAAGNAANLDHPPVGDNPSFIVDTTFSENVLVGSGNVIISSSPDGLDTRTIAVTDASQVSISGDQVTINPLNFETTADIFGPSGQSPASTDVNRTFQSLASEEIAVRAIGNDATSGAAGEAEIWSGAANLGSDDRVALVGNGVDFSDPEAPANQMTLTEAAVAWQSSMGADPGHAQVSLANATVPDAPIFDGGGHTNIISFVNLPLTTQGLV